MQQSYNQTPNTNYHYKIVAAVLSANNGLYQLFLHLSKIRRKLEFCSTRVPVALKASISELAIGEETCRLLYANDSYKGVCLLQLKQQ